MRAASVGEGGRGWTGKGRTDGVLRLVVGMMWLALGAVGQSQVLQWPTDNRSLIEPDGEVRFFAPTPGRTWTAGQFGCVRSEGRQFHEGIDILVTRTDRRGEPLDDVRAVADGIIAYVSRQAALSNYGIYVVIRHRLEGLEVFTVYAHLRDVEPVWEAGRPIRAGQRLGTMGRTANTATRIAKERAHLHFELAFFIQDRFEDWLKSRDPKARNDHGPWNGRNLVGVDVEEVLREQHRLGNRFRLLDWVRNQEETVRVLVADTDFSWLRRYPMLIRRNATAEREGIVAYEVSFTYHGFPFRWIPRARSELDGPLQTRVLAVNEERHRAHPCGGWVFRRGNTWILTARGQQALDLLTYR